jgi:GntR family transcriptional repressor for pyruvate dehydrogenase complex
VDGARVAARAFHERSIKVITTLPNADGPIVSDLAVSSFFSRLLQQMTP